MKYYALNDMTHLAWTHDLNTITPYLKPGNWIVCQTEEQIRANFPKANIEKRSSEEIIMDRIKALLTPELYQYVVDRMK